MRFSAVFVSSAFVLAGMSAAFPTESENILVARFADSDFLAEVDARAYDEEPLFAQRGTISTKNHKSLSATSHYYHSGHDNNLVARGYIFSRGGSGDTPPYASQHRRSFYEPLHELTRRYRWDQPSSRPDTPSSRPGTPSNSSPPPTPGFSSPSTPDFSRPSTPDLSTPPPPVTPRRWGRHQAPTTPGTSPLVLTPNSSRPGTPRRSRSPEWPRSGNRRRSFYDLD